MEVSQDEIEHEVAAVKAFVCEKLWANSPMSKIAPTSKVYCSARIPWLYLRRRPASFNVGRHAGVLTPPHSLIIANIEVAEALRGQGILRALLASLLEPNNEYGALEFELVHNEDLVAFLEREGFTLIRTMTGQLTNENSYFKSTRDLGV